jgi:hypothetical protein
MKNLNLYEISDLLKSIIEKKYNIVPETFVTQNNINSHISFMLQNEVTFEVYNKNGDFNKLISSLFIAGQQFKTFDDFFNISKTNLLSKNILFKFIEEFNNNYYLKKIFKPIYNIDFDEMFNSETEENYIFSDSPVHIHIETLFNKEYNLFFSLGFKLNNQETLERIPIISLFNQTHLHRSFAFDLKNNEIHKIIEEYYLFESYFKEETLTNNNDIFKDLINDFLNIFLTEKGIQFTDLSFEKKFSLYELIKI